MKSVLDTCEPRPELLAGNFNPEVFTANLSPLIEYYRSGQEGIDSVYTDAELFFQQATFPTQGLRLTLREVFGRIAGDMTVPAIHRLETAFGGGKTHTLIACTHIAYKGDKLKDVIQNILEPELLPEPGSVDVVGVAGDEIPVHQPKGDELVPYTLWGEIAYQIGGESLYREVENEASSHAAPGKTYFDKVFGGRKAIIMLDELAQYAARLEAARPDGANQLSAFLMAIHGYARNHSGIAILLTLASAADAFGKQTERLAKLISQVRGEEINEDDALGIGEKAVDGVTSVVARDAVQVTPVQAVEISSVLAKRLFVFVNRDNAKETAEEYINMYRKHASILPDEASNESFKDHLIMTYPFHPTLVNFLNNKLANAENFQGTRGVLRVLSLAVRRLWQNQQPVPMIHTCHLDLRSERVINEILGRTGSSDLLFVLNADVGSVDTGNLEVGHSNAELADQRNPHPEGYPLYEYTWKTVFLHSLVGREDGLESKVFGLTESEALFCVSFPGLTPPQVRTSLEEINKSAFYLKNEQGKYYASEEPTINSIISMIRKTLTSRQVNELLETTARKIVTDKSDLFHIEHDVSLPEHLPDNKGTPILGVVSPTGESIDVEGMVTTKGVNKPREQQNLIFILVPENVAVKGMAEHKDLFHGESDGEQDIRQRVDNIARQVKAMRILGDKPENYGVNPRYLEEEDFQNRKAERENALVTTISSIYTGLYYPSTAGQIVRKEIKTAGGEGGRPFIEQIREVLIDDGELLTGNNTTQSDLVNLSKLFFEHNDTISVEKLLQNFYCARSWPVLESKGVFEQIVRAGVQKGVWFVYRMGSEENVKPEELYHQENEVPLGINLVNEGYSLITSQGAKQRGWTETQKVDPHKVRDELVNEVAQKGAATVQQASDEIVEKHGEVPAQDFNEVIATLIKNNRLYAFQGNPDQEEKPELIHGASATLYTPQSNDVLITPARAAELGWISEYKTSLNLEGKEGAQRLLPLLRRLGSIYNKGAQSHIDNMDLVDLNLPGGGTLRLQLADVTPESMKTLGELFEILDSIVEMGEYTEAFLEIIDPDDECPLIQELKKQ